MPISPTLLVTAFALAAVLFVLGFLLGRRSQIRTLDAERARHAEAERLLRVRHAEALRELQETLAADVADLQARSRNPLRHLLATLLD